MERVGKETRSAIGSTLYGDALSTWRGREPLDRDAAPRRVDAQNRHVEELTGPSMPTLLLTNVAHANDGNDGLDCYHGSGRTITGTVRARW
jgi:hypothetical protein